MNTPIMTLTEEQKRMIQKNREKALEIRRRKALEECSSTNNNTRNVAVANSVGLLQESSLKQDQSTSTSSKRQKQSYPPIATTTTSNDDNEYEEVPLEAFELGKPPTVTKLEAMQIYCLPLGTLDVCTFIEKDNPRNKNFKPMKLYDREEIRRRAHARFGGMDGLVAERKKRQDKKLNHDLDVAKDFFGSGA